MKRLVVGTAGHIDHGKSSLVRALTGVDPDRLDEERRRGITIELGFAELELGDERNVSFVDVPGHERFVRRMVAGAGGFDAVLLVVAADQGVQPQTLEHLEICRLLEIPRGAVALTKIDLVDEDLAAVVQLEVEEAVSGSFLEGAPIVPLSATSGTGLDSMRQVLASLLDSGQARDASGLARLPVDRSFVMKGFGTVVTGTLYSGTIAEGDELTVWPSSVKTRIRGLQVHGTAASRVEAGSRAALNLQTVATSDVPRGSTLAPADAFALTEKARVRLRILAHARDALHKGGLVRFHQGTMEVGARLGALGASAERRPDQDGPEWVEADLFFESPVALAFGDRFILRRPCPLDTVAGGAVVDTDPPRRKRMGATPSTATEMPTLATALVRRVAISGLEGRTAASLRSWAGCTAAEIERELLGPTKAGEVVRIGESYLSGESIRESEVRLLAALRSHHAEHPLEAGLPAEAAHVTVAPKLPRDAWRALIDAGERRGNWRRSGNRIAAAEFSVTLDAAQQTLSERIAQRYFDAGIAPPELPEVLQGVAHAESRSMVEYLLDQGRLVRIQGELLLHKEILDRLRSELAERAATTASFGVPQFKEWTGVSRKHAIPLLEYLDGLGLTRRRGNEREWIGDKR